MSKKQIKKGDMPLAIVTTGGSGGHIFPAEAISRALIDKGIRVAFVTDKRGQAFQGLKGAEVYRLSAESVTGRSVFGKIKAAVKLYVGVIQAIMLMYKLKPSVVVGVGGYASIPAVLAAHMVGIPVVLHEQNAVLGRANRFLAQNARLIATSFEPTLRVPGEAHQVMVGLPARSGVLEAIKTPYPDVKKVFRLLVFGGSQGARFFSTRLAEALIALPEQVRAKIELTQQVRPEDRENAEKMYQNAGFKKVELKSFFDNMPELLKQSHLIIGRGGASTLTELMIVGRPAIIVPLPSAADNHQAENARVFCDAGAGWLVVESDFRPKDFAKRLTQLIENPELLRQASVQASRLARPNAAEKMADVVCDIIKGSVHED